jgi:hypothetical protein
MRPTLVKTCDKLFFKKKSHDSRGVITGKKIKNNGGLHKKRKACSIQSTY